MFQEAKDKITIAELIKDHEASHHLYSAIVANREGTGVDADSAARRQERESRLLTQLNLKLYSKALDARSLQESAKWHLQSDLILAGAGIIGCLAFFAAAAVLNSWAIGRTLGDRIARLQDGASVIGGGNLDYRITIEGKDELAELSNAFNAMTMKLRESYVELEEEIAERKRADEALRRLNDELELRVFERTGELEKSQKELAGQNEKLRQTYQKLQMETAERLEAMEALRQKDQMLIHQSRMAAMGEMLGNIAHQWRQPLNALGLHLQRLLLSYEFGDFSKELLDASVARSMGILVHLSQTIDDFRNFTSPEKEKSTFRVIEVVAKAISLVEANFQGSGIIIETSHTGDPQICGYPNEYTQVLLNLLMNAKDALQERRTNEARILVRTWSENGRAVVTVTDNAGGIKDDIAEHIFDAFFTTKELGKGTGVGLFMSKTIIEKNMGGCLTVRNAEDGAQFRIEV